MTQVGTVAALYRYPVKSMAAEPLRAAEVSWHGITGDRRWAFVQDALVKSGFPYLTIRERAEMWRFVPELANPDKPDSSRTWVRTPEGAQLDVTDPALAERLGGGVRPVKLDRGLFDAAPLSLITTATVDALRVLSERDVLEPERFRPNLLVDAEGDWPEDAWVGHELTIGTLRMRVDRRDERCVIITTDPVTGERDPRVLKQAGRAHDACAGVYGTVIRPGRVTVGDPVVLAS
jgi:uncharacterized protein